MRKKLKELKTYSELQPYFMSSKITAEELNKQQSSELEATVCNLTWKRY